MGVSGLLTELKGIRHNLFCWWGFNAPAVSAGQERIGPVEYRRSQRITSSLAGLEVVPKDQTIFVKEYRLGSRSLYLRSIAQGREGQNAVSST